jgi:diaminohydroxyphosphoribosylaminopyrimidine deaminase/5-amino-6-(5-phosphoribosylamino)uracil reductase
VKIHEKYIKRCIQLAQNGLGTTYPNPMVGSILVYKDKIIGEGWHRKAGEPHAEVIAINSVKDKSLLKKATIYVSLEPCSHYGKTPPCSDFIVASGIKKVVIGTMDPFAKVAGKGIKKLFESGCEVNLGFLEAECKELNKRFFTFHQYKRPYIILKWAQSEDGYIAPLHAEINSKREPVWITNKYSRQLAHKWRSEEQAILVGTNTAVADNPKLNTRLWDGPNPVRIVIDQHLRITKDSALFDGSIKTILICGNTTENLNAIQLRQSVCEFLAIETKDFEEEIAPQICQILYQNELQSVIIEGGTKTIQTFINAGLWDEARVFSGKIQFKKGLEAPKLKGKLKFEEMIAGDQLKIYTND